MLLYNNEMTIDIDIGRRDTADVAHVDIYQMLDPVGQLPRRELLGRFIPNFMTGMVKPVATYRSGEELVEGPLLKFEMAIGFLVGIRQIWDKIYRHDRCELAEFQFSSTNTGIIVQLKSGGPRITYNQNDCNPWTVYRHDQDCDPQTFGRAVSAFARFEEILCES